MAKSRLPVQDRLLEHFRRISDDIRADHGDDLRSGTPEAVADSREAFVREAVGRFFPRTYRVAKGMLFDSHGEQSRSIDCVVCAPNHPLFLDTLGRNTALLVDGVHCAIEVKPRLTDLPPDFGDGRQGSTEIVRGLEQVRSCKRLRRTKGAEHGRKFSEERLDYGIRVPTHIFCMDGPELNALCKYVAEYYVAKSVPLCEQVDLIVILNKGVIQVTKYPDQGLTARIDDPTRWAPGAAALPFGRDSLAYFILHLVRDIGPELLISTPVLQRYFGDFEWPKATVVYRTLPQD